MEKIKIYLAGACRGLSDEGKTWRKDARFWSNYHNKYFDNPVIKVYDPTQYFSRDGSNSISSKQIKEFYLKSVIKNCTLVLVNLNDTQYSVGTGCELQYAECHEIPVIGFGKENVYEWFPDYCDVVFETMEEALNYIVDYYS